jgi:hypothetical protein
MKIICLLMALFFFGLAGAAGVAAAEAQSPEANAAAKPAGTLDEAITNGIQLLEKLKFREFLETYMTPEMVRRTEARFGMEKFTKEFAEDTALRMLAVLNGIKGTKPELLEDGTKAKFDFTKPRPPGTGKAPQWILFTKIGERWYISTWQVSEQDQ